MSYFKIAVLTIFSVSILVGIVIFAVSKSSGSGSKSAQLTVWGTIDELAFNNALYKSSIITNKQIKVTYVRKYQEDFDTDFVEALSEGRGPDVVLLRDDLLYKNRNKLLVIPYKTYSERTFKDIFVEEGEMFLENSGVVAVPFMIDPMVMYWNRDLFSDNQLAQTPRYWEDIYSYVDKLTRKNSTGDVMQSAMAFGGWKNVVNAKEILSMLLLQAGTPITSRSGDEVVSVLDNQFDLPRKPSESAVDFYTRFSNPGSVSYTWNSSLPDSLNFFLQGKLAMYFGFASEALSIKQKNSNLNFDVTSVPQIKDSKKKNVFARMYALAIVKQSKNVEASFAFINAMTEPASLKGLEDITTLPPVRRDLLSQIPGDPFRVIFYNSAIIAHSWIDPDPKSTTEIFRDMIESVTSGKKRISDSTQRANSQLEAELK